MKCRMQRQSGQHNKAWSVMGKVVGVAVSSRLCHSGRHIWKGATYLLERKYFNKYLSRRDTGKTWRRNISRKKIEDGSCSFKIPASFLSYYTTVLAKIKDEIFTEVTHTLYASYFRPSKLQASAMYFFPFVSTLEFLRCSLVSVSHSEIIMMQSSSAWKFLVDDDDDDSMLFPWFRLFSRRIINLSCTRISVMYTRPENYSEFYDGWLNEIKGHTFYGFLFCRHASVSDLSCYSCPYLQLLGEGMEDETEDTFVYFALVMH